MNQTTIDKQIIREYLTKQLKILHQENQTSMDMMDSAVNEGGIVQLEMMFWELLGETAPTKEILLKLKFSEPPRKDN